MRPGWLRGTCQALLCGRMAIALLVGWPRVEEAARRPIKKEPSMLEARSGKYAPRLLRARPACSMQTWEPRPHEGSRAGKADIEDTSGGEAQPPGARAAREEDVQVNAGQHPQLAPDRQMHEDHQHLPCVSRAHDASSQHLLVNTISRQACQIVLEHLLKNTFQHTQYLRRTQQGCVSLHRCIRSMEVQRSSVICWG